MTRRMRALLWGTALGLLIAGGCTRLPQVDLSKYKPESSAKLQEHLVNHQPELELFRGNGPFNVTAQENRELRLSPKERIFADFFLSTPGERAPLVILLHGHESSKAAHSKQARHLASWGMHVLTVQLPNKGPWIGNGRTLARIVRLIHESPQTIDHRINVNKIILVGYSFGATAVTVALGQGVPALGGILLDPAAIGKELPDLLRRVEKPVMIIGADDEVYSTRDREHFFDFMRGAVAEVSIRGAGHEEAQYPSDAALQNGGVDPDVNEELQITFVAALTAAAMSFAATGGVDYAWEGFAQAISEGKFFNAKKK